jgi:hypothetical protein
LDASYQTIAQALVSICPAGFEQARMVAQVGDDWSDIRYDCTVAGQTREGVTGDTATSSKVDDALQDLRRAWPAQPWSSCTFTLSPDGQFKFDVSYDD